MTIDKLSHIPRREGEHFLDNTLTVIDVDRTLFKTDLFSEAMFTILSRHEVPQADTELLEKAVAHNTGNTFDLMREVETLGIHPTADDVMKAVDGRPFLYDGVENLLGPLHKLGAATMILTYGGSNGQRLKLEIIGRELKAKDIGLPPSIITQESRKAEWIDTAWKRADDGRFIVPEGVLGLSERAFSRIIILDDKMSNLETSNDDIEGIKIDNSEKGNGTPIGEVTDEILAKLAH